MSPKYAISRTKRQEAKAKSEKVASLLEEYLEPLVRPLDAYLDKRLVETFLQTIRTYHLNNWGREKALTKWNEHGVLTCKEDETSMSMFLLVRYRL